MIRSTEEQLQDRRDATDSGYACVHVDTCLSCYLLDHHNRDGELLLGVYVTGESTVENVLHDLAMELNETNLEDGERGGFNYDKASASIAALREENKDRLDRLFDASLDVPSDEEFNEAPDEMPQAWFVITWNVEEEEEEAS
jgi:hypothetical protein